MFVCGFHATFEGHPKCKHLRAERGNGQFVKLVNQSLIVLWHYGRLRRDFQYYIHFIYSLHFLLFYISLWSFKNIKPKAKQTFLTHRPVTVDTFRAHVCSGNPACGTSLSREGWGGGGRQRWNHLAQDPVMFAKSNQAPFLGQCERGSVDLHNRPLTLLCGGRLHVALAGAAAISKPCRITAK